MPFDALVAAPRQRVLFEALDDHRLAPVLWETLAAHKLAQQQQYGPSFWYCHRWVVRIMLLVAGPAVGTVVAMSGGFSGHSGVLAITGNFVWMCLVFTFLIGTNVIRLRAGSRWEERTIRAYGDIPEPIASVARMLYNELSGSRLILGELKRQEAVLDPYLLIEHNGESVCLGIWEGNEVIACAG